MTSKSYPVLEAQYAEFESDSSRSSLYHGMPISWYCPELMADMREIAAKKFKNPNVKVYVMFRGSRSSKRRGYSVLRSEAKTFSVYRREPFFQQRVVNALLLIGIPDAQ